MIEDRIKLIAFNKWRKESIDLLTKKEIGKEEFLELNYEYLKKLDLKPFSNINSILQAIYNYQYYNILAKRANLMALKICNNNKKKRQYRQLINNRENFYYLKDLASIKLLELINFKEVDAYFIKLKSKRLTGEIFEIHVKDYEDVILHSKNKCILKKLIEKKCFNEDIKTSLIDSYVNKSY